MILQLQYLCNAQYVHDATPFLLLCSIIIRFRTRSLPEREWRRRIYTGREPSRTESFRRYGWRQVFDSKIPRRFAVLHAKLPVWQMVKIKQVVDDKADPRYRVDFAPSESRCRIVLKSEMIFEVFIASRFIKGFSHVCTLAIVFMCDVAQHVRALATVFHV